MTDFDDPAVRALVERARTPLDSGSMDDEVARALKGSDLSARDRGHLLLTKLVIMQGRLSLEQSADLARQAVDLLRATGSADDLLSALAVAAQTSAACGDRANCLDYCLDMSSILRTRPNADMSYRASANFGSALTLLGADDLAVPLFSKAIAASLSDGQFATGVVVCSTNLAMSLARRAATAGRTTIDDDEGLSYLSQIDEALDVVLAGGPAQQMETLCRAVLTHTALLRGDEELAELRWGDTDALNTDASSPFAQYFCLIEARLTLIRGDIDRSLSLAEAALEHLEALTFVPLGHVEALKMRSIIREQAGDPTGALQDARSAIGYAIRNNGGLADLLIAQIDKRAALEEGQRALLDRTTFLSEQAFVDELSQIGNRRAYETQIQALMTGQPQELAVLMCDIDNFKQINDLLGHNFGDTVIKGVAAIVLSVCTDLNVDVDTLYRYGGDEFVLLAGSLSRPQAEELANHVLQALANHSWSTDSTKITITCSVGVWVGSSVDVEQGVVEADRQMYEAKLAGRNTVRVARTSAPRWTDKPTSDSQAPAPHQS